MWLNNLRSKYNLIPKPITLSPKMITIESDDFRIRQGRIFFYLKEIKEYLKNIVRLREEEKLSYDKILGKVEEKLRRLNRLMETGSLRDSAPSPFWTIVKLLLEMKEVIVSKRPNQNIGKKINDFPYESLLRWRQIKVIKWEYIKLPKMKRG